MIKLNINITAFSAVVAGLLLTVALPFVAGGNGVTHEKGNVINFSAQFDYSTTDTAIGSLKDASKHIGSGERALIKITSPGGSVTAGKGLKRQMKSGLPVDTYVPVMAASMGADVFMQGERRYVEPDAIILFHGAHQGTYGSSQTILELKLNILESKEFKEALQMELRSGGRESVILNTIPIEHLAYAGQLADAVLKEGYEVVRMKLKSSLDIISAINTSLLVVFQKAIDSSNGKLTMEKVRHDIFRDFTEDVVLTGQQVYDLGLATNLGAPDEAGYEAK